MNDRELLKLAAKAAGLSIQDDSAPITLYIFSDGCKTGYAWNPLTDDGDALRLAVILCLEIVPLEDGGIEVSRYVDGIKTIFVLEHNKDKLEATKRCIVRAAAEIGKAEK